MDDGVFEFKNKNYAAAMVKWGAVSKVNDERASLNIGTLEFFGYSISQHYLEAFTWYKKAAALGDMHAQF